jgi:hypothetical protein
MTIGAPNYSGLKQSVSIQYGENGDIYASSHYLEYNGKAYFAGFFIEYHPGAYLNIGYPTQSNQAMGSGYEQIVEISLRSGDALHYSAYNGYQHGETFKHQPSYGEIWCTFNYGKMDGTAYQYYNGNVYIEEYEDGEFVKEYKPKKQRYDPDEPYFFWILDPKEKVRYVTEEKYKGFQLYEKGELQRHYFGFSKEGGTYQGQFSNGKYHGLGIRKYDYNDMIIGYFYNGEPQGFAVYFSRSGTAYFVYIDGEDFLFQEEIVGMKIDQSVFNK